MGLTVDGKGGVDSRALFETRSGGEGKDLEFTQRDIPVAKRREQVLEQFSSVLAVLALFL